MYDCDWFLLLSIVCESNRICVYIKLSVSINLLSFYFCLWLLQNFKGLDKLEIQWIFL